MTPFCLPPDDADEFKRQIISGEIDPARLAAMSSKDRNQFFAERFGSATAKPMNALFESKLLLKNQQQGMINWANRMMGNNKSAQADILSKIKAMGELLTPEDEDAFLEELTAYKLGTRVSYTEAKNIADLSAKVDETKAARDAEAPGSPEYEDKRMDYGRAAVNLKNYVGELESEAGKLSLAEAKAHPAQAAGKILSSIAGNAKSLKASLDNSAIFRQGWKTLLTHPGIWQANARQSFVNLVRAFGGDQVMNEVNADIVSRPTYPLMQTAGLAVGMPGEEAFPTSLPEKIPGIGRAYRASEHAYNAFVRKTRADVFDKYMEIARVSGVPLDTEGLRSIGQMVNSLTGRGNLGKLENVADVVNNVFFSPRMLKSQIDTFTQPITGAGGSSFVRKQASINLLKIVMGTAAILGIARALKKDSVELDPRSTDFGQIKIGHTRFDMSGGIRGIVTLAARLATMSSKSATTGRVHPLNSGKYGSQTGADVLFNFFGNKLSPAASVVKDIAKGQTFQGEKPTVANEAENLMEPLVFANYKELKNDPNSANIILAMIADALGVTTNTYSNKKRQKK